MDHGPLTETGIDDVTAWTSAAHVVLDVTAPLHLTPGQADRLARVLIDLASDARR